MESEENYVIGGFGFYGLSLVACFFRVENVFLACAYPVLHLGNVGGPRNQV